MKNILIIILGMLIIGAGIVYALNTNKKTDKGVTNMTDKKVLVAYFSATGTTKKSGAEFSKCNKR